MSLRITGATEQDVPLVLRFIRALADYEKLTQEVVATEAAIHEALFGPNPVAEVLLAYWDGEPAGFALFFRNFSTFLGKTGIYLEDLFVEPALRGKGIGKALLARLVEIARERGYGRVEWAVLDWNKPAIDFYKSLGATAKAEWTIYRLSGPGLE